MPRWTAAIVGLVGLLGASSAYAQGDSVQGSGRFLIPCDWDPNEMCIAIIISVSATSGPNGENPTGSLSFTTLAGSGSGVVTRLCVSGNEAIIVGRDPNFVPVLGRYPYFSVWVQDNTAAGKPDVVAMGWSNDPITECFVGYDFGPHPLTVGDIVVVDGLTPGEQLDAQVPCSGPAGSGFPWKNHGQFMRSVAQAVNAMVEAGIITEDEADALVSTRAASKCGTP